MNIEKSKTLENSNQDEDISSLISFLMKSKRQCSISFSQKILKKAENLTKFNKKNHSEGNKHITNSDL